jgi:hypothetical protein
VAVATAVKLATCECMTLYKGLGGENRVVFYHHRVLLLLSLLLLCTLQYKRSCEFHAQMTDTQIHYITHEMRFLLYAHVYTYMYDILCT